LDAWGREGQPLHGRGRGRLSKVLGSRGKVPNQLTRLQLVLVKVNNSFSKARKRDEQGDPEETKTSVGKEKR